MSMKPEELKSKIEFEVVDFDDYTKIVKASLNVSSSIHVDTLEFEGYLDRDTAMDAIKENLTRLIMDKLYGEYRNKANTALKEFIAVNPLNMDELIKARNGLIKALIEIYGESGGNRRDLW